MKKHFSRRLLIKTYLLLGLDLVSFYLTCMLAHIWNEVMWKDIQCSIFYNSKRLARSLVPSNTELSGCGVSLHGFMNIMEYYAASQNCRTFICWHKIISKIDFLVKKNSYRTTHTLLLFKSAHISLHFIEYLWKYKQNGNSGSFWKEPHGRR